MPNKSLHLTLIPLRFIRANELGRWVFITMRKIYLLLFVLASTPNFAFAETQCTDRPECWPQGGSMNTGLLFEQQRNAAEKDLARKHKELVNLLSSTSGERLLSTLKAQQAAWLKYRTEECELIGA